MSSPSRPPRGPRASSLSHRLGSLVSAERVQGAIDLIGTPSQYWSVGIQSQRRQGRHRHCLPLDREPKLSLHMVSTTPEPLYTVFLTLFQGSRFVVDLQGTHRPIHVRLQHEPFPPHHHRPVRRCRVGTAADHVRVLFRSSVVSGT
jgi:hypothetical protein